MFDIMLACVALSVYHETRGEPYENQFAVASVVINRAVSRFSGDTCAAAFEPGQFSWTSGGYDRRSGRVVAAGVPADKRAYDAALAVAKDAFYRRSLPNLMYFHTVGSRPGWARGKTVVARYGNHVFYGGA